MNEKITVIKGIMEEIELPVKNVDIIISEWMGSFLLYEGMLDTVLWARDKYLSKNGIMMPDRAILKIAGFYSDYERAKLIDYWDSVYGIDMSCLKNSALSSPKLGLVPFDQIITEEASILDLNLTTIPYPTKPFMQEFNLNTLGNGTMDAIVGWFDVHFFSGFGQHSVLSTSPEDHATHWRQVIFFLDNPVIVNANTQVKGIVGVKKAESNPRFLDVRIKIEYEGKLISDRVYHIE